MREVHDILYSQTCIQIIQYCNKQGGSFPQFLKSWKHLVFQAFAPVIFLGFKLNLLHGVDKPRLNFFVRQTDSAQLSEISDVQRFYKKFSFCMSGDIKLLSLTTDSCNISQQYLKITWTSRLVQNFKIFCICFNI